ncbi:MAG TPA: hypothetical protein P5096_03125 [Patescibacteria group bacterium]|nr:hypothetical protein [Patescibacteria group bacterium]
MKFHRTKLNKLVGSTYPEVYRNSQTFYKKIVSKSKRRPYIRSIYFNKEKIFLGIFWPHLFQKVGWGDRERRLKLFPCAIDLMQNTKFNPESKDNPNKKSEILHRFYGITPDDEKFCVQVKEDKKTDEKFFVSVFPYDDK